MVRTKAMRWFVGAVYVVAVTAAIIIDPITMPAGLVVDFFAGWGAADAWINIIKPWIDAGDYWTHGEL